MASDDARTALLDAAERLFAERGIGSVSLREVGAAAGQRNNSAAQYHFGSREGLVRAVFARRMEPINAQRQGMLDAIHPGDPDELRHLVAAIVEPLAAEITADPTSAYGRFLAQVLSGELVLSASDTDEPFTEAFRSTRDRIIALSDLPSGLRTVRTDRAVQLVVHALAGWESARAAGRPHTPADVLITDLVDTAVAVIAAPTTVTATRTTATRLELAC